MKNYILKISLDDTNIWRKIALPQGFSFSQLHDVIQILFGWEDYHLHEFRTAGLLLIAAEGDDVDLIEEDFKYEDDVNLDIILLNKNEIKYFYDFGDGWELTITVEDTNAEGKEYPQLLDFGGTMAAEDCGGVYGLEDIECDRVNPIMLNMILKETFCN
ncbi:MAG: plasmid pRiA4b ORF-3 family protein [Ruminococcus flavefaciens]|nr:plasmid pRiA4b ORF-3 family protein [Ruminococcus flavefaciens]